jgi:hypothetical protein
VKQNPSLPENLKAGYAAMLPHSTRMVIICTLNKKTCGPSVVMFPNGLETRGNILEFMFHSHLTIELK